jgi:o-succinylbenzoate synthase
MRIADLKVYPVSVPCRTDIPFFATTLETMTSIDFVFVEILTDAGVEGIGEAPTIDTWSEGQTASVFVLEEVFKPALVGKDPFDVEAINHKLDSVMKGYAIAKASIDMALYDLQGKALGVPVYRLLGGKCRERVAISRSVGIAKIEEVVGWARRHVEMGSTTIKLKTGIDAEHDVAAVRAVRREFGEELRIKIDANQGYREPKTAIRAIRRMEEYGLYLAEQPVLGWDLNGMAAVRAAVDTPVVADESLWGLEDVQRVIEKKAADVFCIYISKAGGITKNKKVAHAAESAAVPCILGGMGELGVGTAANLHFAISTPNVQYPSDLYIPPTLAQQDIIREAHRFEGDQASVPEEPGLGVTLDRGKLERYGVRCR